MREITTENVKVGEHIIVDGIEYVAEETNDKTCDLCALYRSPKCRPIPCTGVIFKMVNKKPQYRPYKDTDEMIADFKERFNVKVPPYAMPMIWVTDGAVCSLITDIFPEEVLIYCDKESMKDLFEDCTYLDGSPCGIKEE